jgi:hypothetical protein
LKYLSSIISWRVLGVGLVIDLTINLESRGNCSGSSLHTRIALTDDGPASIERIAPVQSWVAIDQSEQQPRDLNGTMKTNILMSFDRNDLTANGHYFV